MTSMRGISSVALVILATMAGIVGTGLLFTALTTHLLVGLLWGLPLALGGLYWCGRVLALSQSMARHRRLAQRGLGRQNEPGIHSHS